MMDQQEKQGNKPAIPLSLEDSCLAWLINDLEHYSLELLALLPLRLRYRLLANLPVLDLCQLECTSVAVGVDLESIWKLKFPPWNDVQVVSKLTTDDLKRPPLSDPTNWPWRDQYLHVVATAVLCKNLSHYRRTPKQGVAMVLPMFELSPWDKYYSSVSSVALDWLISVKGYLLLNEGGTLESSYDWQGLASHFVFFEAECGSSYDRLTPPRYAQYRSRIFSDADLITLLMNSCFYKPKCLWNPTPSINPWPSTLLKQREPCDTLTEFLNEVEEVELTIIDQWPSVPVVVLQSVCSGVQPKLKVIQFSPSACLQRLGMPDRDEQQKQKCYQSIFEILANILKQTNSLEEIHLRLEPPYNDLFHCIPFLTFATSLPNFISHPQFRALEITNFYAPLGVIRNILYAFLASPCSHKQILKIFELVGAYDTKLDSKTPSFVGQVLDSAVDYKELTLHSTRHPPLDKSYHQVCAMLFEFPKIRLNVLEVGYFQTNTGYINTLHMAAQHPDLHVRSLKIRIRCLEVVGADSAMFKDDLKSLLQIPTLTRLSLPVLPTSLNPGNLFLPTVARELQAHPHLIQERSR